MNIGFDAKRFYHNHTGLGNYSRDVVKAIISEYPANEYFLYTPSISDSPKVDFLRESNNVQIVTPNGVFKKLTSVWRTYFMANNIRKKNINVYHGLSNEIPRQKYKGKTKYVVTIHDLIFLRFPKTYPWIDRVIYTRKVMYAISKADKIIAISEQTKRDLMLFFEVEEHRIEVVYQACDNSFMNLISKEKKSQLRERYSLPDKYLLSVGTLEERKNALLCLKALKSVDELPLLLIGKSTSYKKELDRFIEKNQLVDRVIFLENVPFTDLPGLYQMATVFLYPSRFEGFGIPILEALYSATPVIAATGSSLEEVGGVGSIYISSDDENELAMQINSVLGSEELRNKMIEEGLSHAASFTSENQAKALEKVYRGLLSN
ncbi:MAG: glycosyltransferase involved in cell wall biosynthesis [Lentimonas sp.]|jgi:glycosyltransferase involved in cell wall biosynthesis